MLQISERHKKALQDDNCDKGFVVEFADGTVLGNENIVNGEFSLQDSFCSQDELKVGLCEASILEFECMGVGDLTGKEFKAYIKLNEEYRPALNERIETGDAESIEVFFEGTGIETQAVITCYKPDGSFHSVESPTYTEDLLLTLEGHGFSYTLGANRTATYYEKSIKLCLGSFKVDSCKKQKSGSHKIVAYDILANVINTIDIVPTFSSKNYFYDEENKEVNYWIDAETLVKSSIPWKNLTLSGGTNISGVNATLNTSSDIVFKQKRFSLKSYSDMGIKFDAVFNESNVEILKKYVDESDVGYLKCQAIITTVIDVTAATESHLEDIDINYLRYVDLDYVYDTEVWVPVSVQLPSALMTDELKALADANGNIAITSSISVQAYENSDFANNPTIRIPCIVKRISDVVNVRFVGTLILKDSVKVKDYLQALLELNGMYGVVSKTTGKLEFRTLDLDSVGSDIHLSSSNRKIYCSKNILAGHEIVCGESNDYFISNTYEEYMAGKFGKISVRYNYYDAISQTEIEENYEHIIDESYENTYYLTDNRILFENTFIPDEIKAICEVLAPNIANRSFVPSEVELPSRPWIEAGDSFTTAEGNKAYVLDKKSTLLFDTYTAKGSQKN